MIGGLKNTVRRLNMLVPAMEGVGAEAGYAATARCADIARADVPVDTGALKGSIGVQRGGTYTASVTASAPYAAMVEYGTSKMPPQPYMLPAAHRAAEDFFANARAEAQKAAKEI